MRLIRTGLTTATVERCWTARDGTIRALITRRDSAPEEVAVDALHEPGTRLVLTASQWVRP